MDNLRNLYQEAVLDHYRKPRNFRRMDGASRQAEGNNPLCGDRITVYIQIQDGVIRNITFSGSGCAISISSASMMTELLKGKTEAEAREIFEQFNRMLADSFQPDSDLFSIGTLGAFSSLRRYPVRVKCATLAWHAMRAALEQQEVITSTK